MEGIEHFGIGSLQDDKISEAFEGFICICMAIEHPWGGALPPPFIAFGYFWVQIIKALVFFNAKTHNVPVFFSQ